MEKCLKSSESKKERYLMIASIVMLSLFAVLAYIDIISVMVPFVLVSYGVMSVLSVAYVIFYFIAKGKSFSFDIVNVSFSGFAFFTILSMIVKKGSLDRNVVAIFNLLQIVSVCLCIYVLRENFDIFLKFFCIFLVLFSFLVVLLSPSVFVEENRMIANGITPNVNALGMLMTSAAMGVVFLFFSSARNCKRIYYIVAFLFFTYVLIKTESRTAILCYLFAIFSFVIYGLLKKNKKHRKLLIFILAVLIIISIIVISIFMTLSRDGSTVLSGRMDIWKSTFAALNGNLLFGFGGNNDLMLSSYKNSYQFYSYEFVEHHMLHNIYIQVLAEYGIMTFISFIVMILACITKFIVCYIKRRNILTTSIIWCFICGLMFLIHGCAESSILYIGGPEQFTFLMVMSFCYLMSKENVHEK